jgi:hypothetical protein
MAHRVNILLEDAIWAALSKLHKGSAAASSTMR